MVEQLVWGHKYRVALWPKMSNLLRCEEEDDKSEIKHSKQSFCDPTLAEDLRVLTYLLDIEERYLPSSAYFEFVQTDVRKWMRAKVITWMKEVNWLNSLRQLWRHAGGTCSTMKSRRATTHFVLGGLVIRTVHGIFRNGWRLSLIVFVWMNVLTCGYKRHQNSVHFYDVGVHGAAVWGRCVPTGRELLGSISVGSWNPEESAATARHHLHFCGVEAERNVFSGSRKARPLHRELDYVARSCGMFMRVVWPWQFSVDTVNFYYSLIDWWRPNPWELYDVTSIFNVHYVCNFVVATIFLRAGDFFRCRCVSAK